MKDYLVWNSQIHVNSTCKYLHICTISRVFSIHYLTLGAQWETLFVLQVTHSGKLHYIIVHTCNLENIDNELTIP